MNCPNCGLKLSDPSFLSRSTGTCPNCGHPFDQSEPWGDPSESTPISRFFEDIRSLLFQPRSFFRRMPRNGGLARPLAFALIAHWIGAAIGFLWHSASMRTAGWTGSWTGFFGHNDQIDVIRRSTPWAAASHAFTHWFWGISSVLVDPFYTLITLLITSFFVFLGARIFVGTMSDAPGAAMTEPARARAHEITFESAVRIMAYGTVASILLVIPWAGRFLAWIYGLYLSVVGAKEVYRVGTGRALLIVFFPSLLILGSFLAVFMLLFFFAFRVLGSIFSLGF